MEWVDQLNRAVAYIEQNICAKVDYAEAARIAGCSQGRLQRTFHLMADTTIAEYVRFRKLALAGTELKSTGIKILDLALKYGYESPDAFTRAFQAFHGVTPTSLRTMGLPRPYPPLHFEVTITPQSVKLGGRPVVQVTALTGRQVLCFCANDDQPERHAWNLLRAWVKSHLNDYSIRQYIGCAPKGHHPAGEAHHPNEVPVTHEYHALMLLLEGEAEGGQYAGMAVEDAPMGLFLVGDVVFNEFDEAGNIDIGASMQKSSRIIYDCMVEIGGYELDMPQRCFYEEHVFASQWFDGEDVAPEMKVWLPIRRVQ